MLIYHYWVSVLPFCFWDGGSGLWRLLVQSYSCSALARKWGALQGHSQRTWGERPGSWILVGSRWSTIFPVVLVQLAFSCGKANHLLWGPQSMGSMSECQQLPLSTSIRREPRPVLRWNTFPCVDMSTRKTPFCVSARKDMSQLRGCQKAES